jgi:hypothetical protein
MIDWDKLQPLYERKAYRIVQKHISTILNKIPYQNATLSTYELLINGNISEEDVYLMFKELYETIGIDYGNQVNKEIEKTKKVNILFNEYLLSQILLFLSKEGGLKITSVRDILISYIIKSIKETLKVNGTVIDLKDAIYQIVSKPNQFYKWQALRIARTETTSAANFAAFETAKQSDLLLDKVWISVQDDRTRLNPFDHLDMNNQKQDLEKPFFVGGENIQYPGDSKASAGNVINCRCSVSFIPRRDANGMLILK